jgi:hypothetical protein
MAKKQRNWKVVVIGDTTYENIKAETPEEAIRKAGAAVPEGWEVSTVGNTVIISPPIKLG